MTIIRDNKTIQNMLAAASQVDRLLTPSADVNRLPNDTDVAG